MRLGTQWLHALSRFVHACTSGICCRFDAPRFYAECRRVLKPSGALAVFSYIPLEIHFTSSRAASEVLQK